MWKNFPGCLLIALLTGLLWAPAAIASHPQDSETAVLLSLDEKTTAYADYLPGDADKPAILLLHPFLQTGSFSTIRQLGEELSDAGYPVLLPTLTLGVNARREPLPCEAIHTSSLADTAREVAAWVRWLEKGEGDKRPAAGEIILMGHSSGTLTIAEYGRQPSASVKKLILLSLPYFYDDEGKKIDRQQMQLAEQRRARGDRSLDAYALSYCKKYVATAEAFLSFAELSRERVIRLLRQVKAPLTLVMGSKDVRVAADWPAQLERQGFNVRMIEGGTHFFNRGHEFELVDVVESEIER